MSRKFGQPQWAANAEASAFKLRSSEWYAAVIECNALSGPSPRRIHSAKRAVVEWCAATRGDIRAQHLIAATDDAAGGRVVGRALRFGLWSGLGLADMVLMLDKDPAWLIEAVDGRRRDRLNGADDGRPSHWR